MFETCQVRFRLNFARWLKAKVDFLRNLSIFHYLDPTDCTKCVSFSMISQAPASNEVSGSSLVICTLINNPSYHLTTYLYHETETCTDRPVLGRPSLKGIFRLLKLKLKRQLFHHFTTLSTPWLIFHKYNIWYQSINQLQFLFRSAMYKIACTVRSTRDHSKRPDLLKSC